MKKMLLFIFSIAFILLVGCKKKTTFTPVCDGSNPTYNSTIALIIASNCIDCHSNYSTYAGLSSITSNGKFEQQVLSNQKMPQNGSLSEVELNKIRCWVDNGFLEN